MRARQRTFGRGLVMSVTVLLTALPGALVGHAQTPDTGTGFQLTKVLTRTNLVDGKDVNVDSRTFSLTVDRIKGLRDRDGLQVSWSGAHPTGGLVGDINSSAAIEEEYPVVLLQCRGVDTPTAPLPTRLRPETCFTQAPNERYIQESRTAYPPWRLDRFAPLPERGLTTNVPSPFPADCPHVGANVAQHFLPFVAASGRTYPVGSGGCAGMPPEMSSQATLGLPSNSTYGITTLDGRGSARFDVRAAEDNASLGCSAVVACSLVVVPIMGVSCDVGASLLPVADRPTDSSVIGKSNQRCQASGHFRPGEFNSSPLQEDVTVAGALWWSASNWRQRITVPLSFAPGAETCELASSKTPVFLYGSELLTQATAQWSPSFCLNPQLTPFRHVQTGEPQARNLLTSGSIQAALTSRLPSGGFSKPTVAAPVALSGFAIGYSIDDAHQVPIPQLRLTPRLLAKLLSQSYPMTDYLKRVYPDLSGNPINISSDPEFRALNPSLADGVPATEAASTLLALSSDSDVMHRLTSYLQVDPDARAFLNGTADPWGMVVNPHYKGIALPVDNWPLLDTFVPPTPINPCLERNPVSYAGLAAAPTQRLATIALDLQYSLSPSQVVCQLSPLGTAGDKLVALGRQGGGYHFMLGVISLADARRFGVSTASLLTATAPEAAPRFTTAEGRTFVAPSDESLSAAAALLRHDPAAGTWQFDAETLRSQGARAYPGAMLVQACIPLTGLPASAAVALSQFLDFAAGAGQVRGVALGQLPAGYLPLTKAFGLAALADYTRLAASGVAAQRGTLSVPAAPGTKGTPTPGTRPSGSGPAIIPPTGDLARPAAPRPSSPTQARPPQVAASPFPTPALAPAPVAFPAGITTGAPLGMPVEVFPLLLLLGLVAGGLAFAATGWRPLPARKPLP